MNAKKLKELALKLLGDKQSLSSLHQEIAENFYPQRADFTMNRALGDDFMYDKLTSYPMICRRELGNQFSTMLRPTSKPWFHAGIRFQEKIDTETKQYLEGFEQVQRRAMYDPLSLFTRATKEGDHDFASFGQCVISLELAPSGDRLLYRSWHMRDVAWQEDETGQIGTVVRRWKPTIYEACKLFEKTGNLDSRLTQKKDKEPFTTVDFIHIVVVADMYDDDARGRPRWSIYYDCTHDKLVQAVPIWGRHYIIPRWETVSNSQYAYSPAAVCALPDARLIQAMTFTLLEAGEKASNPPMVATKDAVRSDMALYAGGVTWVDNEYDEKLGEALRPVSQDYRGMTYGIELNRDVRAMIHKAFYLDALTLPERAPEMTAYEVGQRVQEYIRAALPLFEPMELDYNAALCEETFDILWRNGAFGDPRTWPSALRGADISFHFESPLHDAIEEVKGQKYQQAVQLTAEAVGVDPTMRFLLKGEQALRDALMGIGVPATWLNNPDEVQKLAQQEAEQQQAMQTLEALKQGSEVSANLSKAGGVPAIAAGAGG